MSDSNDPFQTARQAGPVMTCPFQGENLPMILRHADVRRAAKDWQTFSSDAPFRIPIPSEEGVRTMRQLPIEIDPPQHAVYRKLVEPFFKRAKHPDVVAKAEMLVKRMIGEALQRDTIEAVREFALPLQSHALTYLLNVDEAEAETWIGWGTHVFKDGGDGEAKGAALENYLHAQFDRAVASPGDDFFSALCEATIDDRALTRDEMMGFANLTFAGGRDTIIHTITGVLGYLAEHPEALTFLREDPNRIVNASEEFFRILTPLTHIGRVCPERTEVHGVAVPAQGRVSLCWASANFDETVFEAPQEARLDRKPNPHIAFGAGPHLCLGAPHARLIVRTLLREICEQVRTITKVAATDQVEREARYDRKIGYESLTLTFD